MVTLPPSIRRQRLLSGPNEQTSLVGAPATAGDRNGTGVVAASSDETVCVWDAATGRELAALQRNRRGLFSRLQRSWKAHRHSIGRPYPMGSRAPRRTGSRLQSGCGCSSAGQARGGAGPEGPIVRACFDVGRNQILGRRSNSAMRASLRSARASRRERTAAPAAARLPV
jgi:hypothetical protein